MGDTPWQGDACSLVEEFRAGRRSPAEELQAVYDAVDASSLNAICHTDPEAAFAAARIADVTKPFGGVPMAVKELESVAGWPDTHASVPLRDRIASSSSPQVERLQARGGAVLAGQSTSSEFGGVNLTRTVLHGATLNPWNEAHTPGGSSGGAAAAVAGGLFTLGTASDGGGSIRIPAGFCGLVGLKATFGRIPLGPNPQYGNLTVVTGCVSRSVRDTARWFDVCNGHDPNDPLSLQNVDGWEAALGSISDSLRGARVAFAPNWGNSTVSPVMWELLHEAGEHLVHLCGLRQVEHDTTLPRMGAAWSLSGNIEIEAQLRDFWPACADQLTPEIRFGMELSAGRYNSEARDKIERRRAELNAAMARIFDRNDGVDFVITATNPDVAFGSHGPLPSVFGGIEAGAGNNGRLTFAANLHGNPAISIPAGAVDGLPIGLQVVGRHFDEQRLLELALTMERSRPWPLVASR
jgi:aspartyl-tRNA(Asn)/glutamyl-tRNA(Gln) amidotransferase subunit A